MSGDPCADCKAHSGVDARICSLKTGMKELKDAVDTIRKFIFATLVSSVGTLAIVLLTVVGWWLTSK